MSAHQYDQKLDVAQIAFVAFSSAMLIDGMHGVLDRGGTGRRLEFAIGTAFLCLAWLRNFRHVWATPPAQKVAFPARPIDGSDRIVVWTTVLTVLGLALGPFFDNRWYLGFLVAGLVGGVLLVLRLRFPPKGQDGPEAYVLPAIALLGPVRMVCFAIGAYATVRSLNVYDQRGGHGEAIAVLAVGLGLLVLTFIEQGVLTRRRRPKEELPPDELSAVMATLERIEKQLQGPKPPTTPPGGGHPTEEHHAADQPEARPLWLVAIVAAALITFAVYVAWAALHDTNGNPAVAPIVLAGLALILGTMGERLANLTFKLGQMEATLSDGPGAPASGGAPQQQAGAGAPKTEAQAPAIATAKVSDFVDLDALDPLMIYSPSGEHVGTTLHNAIQGQGIVYDARALLGVRRDAVEVEVTPSPTPAPQRTLMVKGPARDVKDLINRAIG